MLVIRLCPTLCDAMDCIPPGSSIQGTSQARILEWVAISFSRGSSQPGIKPRHPAFQADSLPFEPPGKLMLMHCNECIWRLKVYWLSNLLPSWTYLVPIIYVMSSGYVILLKVMPASFPPVLVSQIHAPYEKQSPLRMATESFSV